MQQPAYRFIVMSMGKWRKLTLTPALSPRRGGASIARMAVKSVGAFDTLLTRPKRRFWSNAYSALPLLGERAGVRAVRSFQP
jgi:hypothetical protein